MSKCEERAFCFVCMGYGGVIGYVAVRIVLSVTNTKAFEVPQIKKKTGNLYSLWNMLM
jgi:hypothetical protein